MGRLEQSLRKLASKLMPFPEDEVESLKGRNSIITHRVSKERGKYDKGDVVSTSWGDRYVVSDRSDLRSVDDSPYAEFLTPEQRKALLKKKIALLTLRRLEKRSESRLYTYLPEDNTADVDGILSTALTENGWEKYRGRTRRKTRKAVLRALDAMEPDWRRSMSVSALAEPIPDDAAEDLKEFARSNRLYSFDVDDLVKAKILKHLRETNKGKGTHEAKSVSKGIPDWKRKPGKLIFRGIPHYMVETEGGRIPAELIRSEKKAQAVTPEEIEAMARPHYADSGSHGWNHIQDVLASARRMRRKELLKKELAALMYHDSSILTGPRETHAEDSADIARKELAGKFSKRQLAEIANAIAHHRASYEGKRKSKLENLVAAADRDVFVDGNIDDYILRSYRYGLEHGMTPDEAVDNTLHHMPDKYGTRGYAYANVPKIYMDTYRDEVRKAQKAFDSITADRIREISKSASSKRRETYESGEGEVESYTKDKTKDHDEIVLRTKDGRRIIISNNTRLGKRLGAKKGDRVNYNGYRVKGTDVVHKVHPNRRQRGGWLEHVKAASTKGGEMTEKERKERRRRILRRAIIASIGAGALAAPAYYAHRLNRAGEDVSRIHDETNPNLSLRQLEKELNKQEHLPKVRVGSLSPLSLSRLLMRFKSGVPVYAQKHKGGYMNAAAVAKYDPNDPQKGFDRPFVLSLTTHPKILAHELGHVMDYKNGTFVRENFQKRKSRLKEAVLTILAPSSTTQMQNEIRAWDNAKVDRKDPLRRAALGTYYAGQKMDLAKDLKGPVALSSALALGYDVKHGKKKREEEEEKDEPDTKRRKGS